MTKSLPTEKEIEEKRIVQIVMEHNGYGCDPNCLERDILSLLRQSNLALLERVEKEIQNRLKDGKELLVKQDDIEYTTDLYNSLLRFVAHLKKEIEK